MKYAVVLLVAMVMMAVFVEKTEAAPRPEWEGLGKEIEGLGQRVFAAANKALPVVQGYAELFDKFKKKDSDEEDKDE